MSAFSHICINIGILFAELPTLDTIVEKTLSSDLQQNVEVSKSDSEEPAQKEHNNTGNIFVKNYIVNNFKSSSFHLNKNIGASV